LTKDEARRIAANIAKLPQTKNRSPEHAQVDGACCSAGWASQTERAAIAAPIVGEQSMRIRFASRSF
jgi:hypothetical protein